MKWIFPLVSLLVVSGVSAADPLPTIEEKTAGMVRTEGFFPF